MKKLSFISLILVILTVSCSQPESRDQSKTPDEQAFKSDTHQQFFNNLSDYAVKSLQVPKPLPLRGAKTGKVKNW